MPRKELTTAVAEPMRDNGAIQVETTLRVRPRRHESRRGGQPEPVAGAGLRTRVPRITRLMALAIKFQDMVDRREVRDYADLARLGYVTRARITQVMNLLMLSPEIQEIILFSPGTPPCHSERELRSLLRLPLWCEQIMRLRQIEASK